MIRVLFYVLLSENDKTRGGDGSSRNRQGEQSGSEFGEAERAAREESGGCVGRDQTHPFARRERGDCAEDRRRDAQRHAEKGRDRDCAGHVLDGERQRGDELDDSRLAGAVFANEIVNVAFLTCMQTFLTA